MRIPLVPIPVKHALVLAKRFRKAGAALVRLAPGLQKNLYQAELKIEPVDYMSLAFLTSIFYFILICGLIAVVSFAATGSIPFTAPLIGLFFGLVSFYYMTFYPRMIAMRRMRALEKNLLFALRHLLISIRAGIPLFDAMVGVSTGYGEVSTEFKQIVHEINAGASQTEALDSAARRNPSMYFRRALWQLVNALRAGADIADTLKAITDDFAKRQTIAIRKYGQELNPWTVMYMMIAVIMPSLGITFLIILTSFMGLVIPKLIFPLILLGLGLFQFFFLGFVRSRRPTIL